jgi:hypothetical protein
MVSQCFNNSGEPIDGLHGQEETTPGARPECLARQRAGPWTARNPNPGLDWEKEFAEEMVSRPLPIKPGIASLTAAFLALFIFAIAATGSAQAAGYNWEFEGRTLPERGLQAQTTSSAVEQFTLTSTALGQPFKVTCSGTTASGKISNGGTGEFSLSGCTVVEPAICTAKPFTITAKTEIVSVGGKVYEKFTPPGTETRFALITLQNCYLAGTYQLRGSFAGETREYAWFTQPLTFSPAIDAAAGTAMTLGTKPAALTGSLEETVTGTAGGMTWGRKPLRADIRGWQIGLSMLGSGFSETVAITGGPASFSTTLLGSPAEFSCSSVGAKNAKILGTNAYPEAEERFVFSGCAMAKPSGCTIPSTVETEPVRSASFPVDNYIREGFNPEAAEWKLFTLNVQGCAAAGTFVAKGTFGGKGTEVGHAGEFQPITFSSSNLQLGGQPLALSGGFTRRLNGEKAWWGFMAR